MKTATIYKPKIFVTIDTSNNFIHPFDMSKQFTNNMFNNFNNYKFDNDECLERQNWAFDDIPTYANNITPCNTCTNLNKLVLHFVEDGVYPNGCGNAEEDENNNLLHKFIKYIQTKYPQVEIYAYGSEQHVSLMGSRSSFLKLTEYKPAIIFDDDDYVLNGFDPYYTYYTMLKHFELDKILYTANFSIYRNAIWNIMFLNNSHTILQHTNTMNGEDTFFRNNIVPYSFNFRHTINSTPGINPALYAYMWASTQGYDKKDILAPNEFTELRKLLVNDVEYYFRSSGGGDYKYKPDIIIKTVAIKDFKIYSKNTPTTYNFYINRPIIPMNNVKPRRLIIYDDKLYNIENIIDEKYNSEPYNQYFNYLMDTFVEIIKYHDNHLKLNNIFHIPYINYKNEIIANDFEISPNICTITKDLKLFDVNNNEISKEDIEKIYNIIYDGFEKIHKSLENDIEFIKYMITIFNTKFYNLLDKKTKYNDTTIDLRFISEFHPFSTGTEFQKYYRLYNLICMLFMTIYHDLIKNVIINNCNELSNENLKQLLIIDNIFEDENTDKIKTYVKDELSPIDNINRYLDCEEFWYNKNKNPHFKYRTSDYAFPYKYTLFGSGNKNNILNKILMLLIVFVIIAVIVVVIVVVIMIVKNKNKIKIKE